MKPARLILSLLLIAASALAADVDGKWSGEIETPGGDVSQDFTFKASGTKLTGSLAGPEGKATAIQNGKIEGAKISFTAVVNFNGDTFTVKYTGVVEKARIKLTGDTGGMTFELSLKKGA
jgi:hypothetical protein